MCIRDRYIGVFFKRYILGLWAAAEGVIYDMFDEARHVRDIKDFFQLLINGNRYVSCDYGTQNATVFLLWNKGRDGVWYCIREYYYSGRDKGRQKTDSEYAAVSYTHLFTVRRTIFFMMMFTVRRTIVFMVVSSAQKGGCATIYYVYMYVRTPPSGGR